MAWGRMFGWPQRPSGPLTTTTTTTTTTCIIYICDICGLPIYEPNTSDIPTFWLLFVFAAHSNANNSIVQFDGSAHRSEGIGGAGAALLQVGPRGVHLLKWGSLSLYPCKDNIVAEAYGAELAITLYSEYVRDCRKERDTPPSLSTIQGDIKPLIHHL